MQKVIRMTILKRRDLDAYSGIKVGPGIFPRKTYERLDAAQKQFGGNIVYRIARMYHLEEATSSEICQAYGLLGHDIQILFEHYNIPKRDASENALRNKHRDLRYGISIRARQRPSMSSKISPNGCAHHWIIDTPSGPESDGRCVHCRAERSFRNSNEAADDSF